MSSAPLLALVARCRSLCRPRSNAADAELLSRFAQSRDVAAFEELLERYASMVWGVCRRMTPTEADGEDAFQATFLALVRQAGSLHGRQPLGGWLHTVAARLSRKAASRAGKQCTRPTLPQSATSGDIADEVGSRELSRMVDEEIERLPDSLRVPLLLCCLQGRTRDEAAETLGCSVAAVKSRLERGRELLRRRLERRGVQLPAAFLVLGLTSERIRAALWAKTMQSVLCIPAPALVALADAGVSAASIGKSKLILAALLLVSSAAGVAGSLWAMKTPEPPDALAASERTAAEANPETPQKRRDRHGEPLPQGAIARLGTVRWRHGAFVHALAYSPDGKRIVTAGIGRALVLWDAATGKELRVFPSRGEIRSAAFSPDGKVIATAGTAMGGRLWDADTGKMLCELKEKGIRSIVFALAFAPDGKVLATVNWDKVVRLWDAKSGAEKHCIDCQQGDLQAVAFAPDGKLLALAGSDGTIRLWDAATYKEVRRMAANKKYIRSLVFSPNGKWLASSNDGDSPCLWDVAAGREIRRFGDKQGTSGQLAFSPDGKLLASGYSDGTFRLWDAANGEEKRHWRGGAGPASGLAFSPDGKTLASAAHWVGGIRFWDVATGRERHSSEDHRGLITLLRFSARRSQAEPGNELLISAGFDQNVLCWDLATQTPHRQLSWTRNSCWAAYSMGPDHSALLTTGGYALSADGNTLAAGIFNADFNADEVWLWDVRTGKATKLPGLSGKVRFHCRGVAFSPDGRLLALGGQDETIHIWDVRLGKEVRQIENSTSGNGLRLLFSPDGKTLVWGTRRPAALCLGDVASGKQRRFFENQGDGVSPEAFSPDGKVLAVAMEPSQRQEMLVRLIDAATGKEWCRYGGHRRGIGAVAFSPDGKLVVSGGSDAEDSSVHVWEAATGKPIRRFEGHHSWVGAVTFAADGMTVASGAGDSTILLWDITGRQKDGKLRLSALTPRQLDACWTALGNEDTAKAYDAVWALVAAPEQAVSFSQKHLPPIPRPDAKMVARLIADLDSEDFMARRKSTEELSKFGEAIASNLRQALKGKPSLEMRRRIQQLLDQSRDWTAERLRVHRAVQAMEHIGTMQAQQVLQALAAGALGAYRTEEAKAALRRTAR